LLFVNLDAADQGANDFASGQPISCRQPATHFGDKVLQLSDDQPQVALLGRFVCELLYTVF
jgi:hypothetical protein